MITPLRIALDKAEPTDVPWLRKVVMPKGAKPLPSLQILPQHGPCIWILADPHQPAETRFMAVLKGGEELPDTFTEHATHLGTQAFQLASTPGRFHIMHVFEVSPAVAIQPAPLIVTQG